MTQATLYTPRGCQVDIDTGTDADLRRPSPMGARARHYRRRNLDWQPA